MGLGKNLAREMDVTPLTPPTPPLSGLTFTYAFFLTLYLNYGLWTMEYGHTFGHIPFGIISCWAFFIFVITD